MKDATAIDIVIYHTIPLFSELSEDELKEVLAFSLIKRFKKNAQIFLESDPYKGFYVVLKGSVKVYKVNHDGKEFIMHLLQPYALVADVPMFEKGNYPAHAVAMENAVLLFVPKKAFLGFLENSPPLMRKMLGGFAKKIRTLSLQLENLTLHDVSCRLARHLVDLVEEAKRGTLAEPFVHLDSQKSVLASQLGTISETLYRTLKKLEVEGIIKTRGRTIIIPDYKALRALAEYRIHP
jgi:CRP/FNR family transcriptional regulator